MVAYPNPANNYFNLQVNTNDRATKRQLQVYDQLGKLVESKELSAGSAIRLGENYKTGVYFVRVTQGKQHSKVKLLKLSE